MSKGTVGIIGLGIMGGAIAKNLSAAGWQVIGFDIAKDYPAIGAWLGRMKALPGWKHPYELMPGHPLGTK